MKNKRKNHKLKTFFKVIIIIIAVITLFLITITFLNNISANKNKKFIQDSITAVNYENQLTPVTDENGYTVFTTDNDFHIMQLTDIHLGGSVISGKKDLKAINAVASMITAEKPDLVVVTGDISYAIHVMVGTVNNKRTAETFAELMEKLGVYWCLVFGNHDTEPYDILTRDDLAKLYSDREKYPHCLFCEGPDSVDGWGNYVINVKNTKNEIVESLFMLDSQMYTKSYLGGLIAHYDCIHENQVEWYVNELNNLTEINNGKVPKSLMFYHIPPIEMKDAYTEYINNNSEDTQNVKYICGKIGEKDKVICSSEENYGIVDAALKSGSTQAMFLGHDHFNSFCVNYKGIDLNYSLSIDYLAYFGIKNYGVQRGCTLITVNKDGTYTSSQENYYQDKYQPVIEKETVSMVDMYG